jgi:hypothetical protein
MLSQARERQEPPFVCIDDMNTGSHFVGTQDAEVPHIQQMQQQIVTQVLLAYHIRVPTDR